MKQMLKKQRGESIIESMVAISIIVTSLVGIMALFSDNIRTNQSTKNKIIAINLAREGIEAVRYVRDSNWLVYSNQRRVCWNNNTTATCVDADSDGRTDTPLNGNYNANMDPSDFSWELTSDSDGIDRDDNLLYLKDGFYQHDATGTGTTFMRQIQISYPDGNSDKTENNRMNVKSVVQWSNNEKIELEAVLTDFLERRWHDD